MQLASVRLDVRDTGLAVVTLCQPERGNPIDGTFVVDFKTVVLQLWETPGLRAVLLQAEGANFSFGGDLKSFYPERERLAPVVRNWTSDLHMALQRFWQLPVPTIAATQGFVMGGAVALAAGCDFVVAARTARFGSAFTQIGFSCDSGSTIALTTRMGAARAKRFVMLSQVLDSEQALQSGLVDQVVDDAALAQAAVEFAGKLAAGPTAAYGEVKRLFLRASAIDLQGLLEDEALTLARVAQTRDAQEGVAAIVEKRKPVFHGR